MSIEESIASRKLEAWCVAQAKRPWRAGRCLWDWMDWAAEEDQKREAKKAKMGGGRSEAKTP